MSVAMIEGAIRTGYNPLQQSISALSLGPREWIQKVSFFIFGIIISSTVPAWRKILAGGKGATTFPVLTFLTGCSLILCGIFPQDPAPGYDPDQFARNSPTLPGTIHLLFAGVGAGCTIAGLVIMARRFAETTLWHRWKFYPL